ncbi:helix-hairpin-helix domain-containing protein [Leucobacter sp. GX24907]
MPAPRSPEIPEPIEWAPPQAITQRLVRAISAPMLVGGAVLLAAIIVSIVVVLARPHAWDEDSQADGSGSHVQNADPGAAAQADGDLAGTEAAAESDVGPARVFVHIVGEVREPGVYELPSDARVEAALAAAGGATEQAALSGVNLARTVVDGEQIQVPDAKAAAKLQNAGAGSSAAGSGAEGAGAGGASAGGEALIDLNAADAAALQTLPRIGPALAQRIIEWREANGAFTSVDQLTSVSGIGAKTLEGIRDRVSVQ